MYSGVIHSAHLCVSCDSFFCLGFILRVRSDLFCAYQVIHITHTTWFILLVRSDSFCAFVCVVCFILYVSYDAFYTCHIAHSYVWCHSFWAFVCVVWVLSYDSHTNALCNIYGINRTTHKSWIAWHTRCHTHECHTYATLMCVTHMCVTHVCATHMWVTFVYASVSVSISFLSPSPSLSPSLSLALVLSLPLCLRECVRGIHVCDIRV